MVIEFILTIIVWPVGQSAMRSRCLVLYVRRVF